ncbi:MAG: hypothetical protein ACOX3T_03365 [Bdellovibrionota bacterium]
MRALKLLLFLLILPCSILLGSSAFSITLDDSFLGTSSTKIRVLLGEPLEKVEYKLLNKSSFVYPEYVLYFKDEALQKIVYRNEDELAKKDVAKTPSAEKIDDNPNLVNEMFSN